MTTPNAAAKGFESMTGAELEEELRQADAEFAQGDFIEVTLDELDRCIAAGQWPWPEASSA